MSIRHRSTLLQERIRTLMPLILSRTSSSSASTFLKDSPSVCGSQAQNIIIFGESGVGKSSVINLIAGRELARTSPDAGACTFASKPYHVVLGDCPKSYCIWDTIGLNEPDISREDYLRSIKHAYKLINDLERSGGIHLLLLCMRGRITGSVQQNYNLFVNVLCEKKVPLGVVVTNLENEPGMEKWWTNNKEVFERYGISADGHACITAISGKEDAFRERKEESRETMHQLLLELTDSVTSSGWKKEKMGWLIGLLGKMMKFFSRLSRLPTNKELMAKLVKECKFPKKTAADIADAIIEIRAQNGERLDGDEERYCYDC